MHSRDQRIEIMVFHGEHWVSACSGVNARSSRCVSQTLDACTKRALEQGACDNTFGLDIPLNSICSVTDLLPVNKDVTLTGFSS